MVHWQAISALTQGRLGSTGDAATPSTEERCTTAMRESLEGPVLMAVNAERCRTGAQPLSKLTVPVLKAHLKGKLISGQEWRAGSKKRSELIKDYRCAFLKTLSGGLELSLKCCNAVFNADIRHLYYEPEFWLNLSFGM